MQGTFLFWVSASFLDLEYIYIYLVSLDIYIKEVHVINPIKKIFFTYSEIFFSFFFK